VGNAPALPTGWPFGLSTAITGPGSDS
jgi:hypothetical protein